MTSICELKSMGEDLGLEGEGLVAFIKEQQNLEREERAKQRESEREAREHELKLLSIRSHNSDDSRPALPSGSQFRYPSFSGGDLAIFLVQFERLAELNLLPQTEYAPLLGSLLQGRALEIYVSLPAIVSSNYVTLKQQLLESYNLTPEFYRRSFREATLSEGQTFKQFAIQLTRYFEFWLDSCKIARTFATVLDFMVMDQFLTAVPVELRIFIKEQGVHTLKEIVEVAERYASAHKIPFRSRKPVFTYRSLSRKHYSKPLPTQSTSKQNFKPSFKTPKVRCFACGVEGHKSNNCPQGRSSKYVDPGSDRGSHKVNFAFGDPSKVLPSISGQVNGQSVSNIVRDTGCTCIIVSNRLLPSSIPIIRTVNVYDYLGRKNLFPVVKCHIDCSYFQGWAEVVSAPIKFCSVLVGQVQNASISEVSQVVTRSAARKTTLKLSSPSIPVNFSPDEFKKEQATCPTLKDVNSKVQSAAVIESRTGSKFKFIKENGLVYRQCLHDNNLVNVGHKCLVIPLKFRNQILQLAHDSPFSGHFSHRKTEDKIFQQFYWPSAFADITRYCRSCDICQRTSQRGRIKPAPLQRHPLISEPFSRVSMDIIGPISPASSEGHKYILTVIDMATRFPDACPLKNIDSISVAEALISIFSRVGLPKEILSDRGRQFTSALMEEIDRLLKVKPLFTTPYHPACNGLVEHLNGVLKSILRKICSDHPESWHRYLPAALFAFREIPSRSLGFSPFELVYGRQVRGPLSILAEMWTNSDVEGDVRSTYQYVLDLRQRLEESAKLALNNSDCSATLYKNYFDSKSLLRKLKVGDEVLVLLPTSSNKLLTQWKGPFQIVEKRGPVDYAILINNQRKVFHINLLKQYIRRPAIVNTVNQFADVSLEQTTDQVESRDCPMELNEVSPLHARVCDNSLMMVHTALIESVPPEEDADIFCIDSNSDSCNISPELSHVQRQAVVDLLAEFPDVLSSSPGCTNVLEHHIQLITTEPIRGKLYPIPIHLQQEFDKEVNVLFEMGIIEPSESPYRSPVIMIKKADSSWRLVIDFRALNTITEFDAEPMPTLEENLTSFVQCKYISEIDLCKAYYQIPLSQESRRYTAFPTHKGLMQFKRMPFGLVTACATFTRLMRKVLQDIPHSSFYFDNVYIHSNSWDDHLIGLRLLLNQLRGFHLTAKPNKCFIGFTSIDYLGLRLGNDSLRPTDDKIKAITQMSIPRNKKQLQSFLGTMSFYRKFIPNFATISAPLTDLLKKGRSDTIQWAPERLSAFHSLRTELTKAPVLKLPNPEKPFVLRTDASGCGIAGVLLQYDGDTPHPVAYASRKLLPREIKYSTIEKECLAVVWSVRRFRHYLYGRPFSLETDHQPLAYLKKLRDSNDRLMRWSLSLQPYQYNIAYIKGKDNVGADLLSRCPVIDSLD